MHIIQFQEKRHSYCGRSTSTKPDLTTVDRGAASSCGFDFWQFLLSLSLSLVRCLHENWVWGSTVCQGDDWLTRMNNLIEWQLNGAWGERERERRKNWSFTKRERERERERERKCNLSPDLLFRQTWLHKYLGLLMANDRIPAKEREENPPKFRRVYQLRVKKKPLLCHVRDLRISHGRGKGVAGIISSE